MDEPASKIVASDPVLSVKSYDARVVRTMIEWTMTENQFKAGFHFDDLDINNFVDFLRLP
jgi:hypothetical protein